MAAVNGFPAPFLQYGFWRSGGGPCGEGIVGDGPAIHKVHEVSACVTRGELSVWVRGRMLKRDGTPGPNRGLQVDLSAVQPAWLVEVVEDARRRLDG